MGHLAAPRPWANVVVRLTQKSRDALVQLRHLDDAQPVRDDLLGRRERDEEQRVIDLSEEVDHDLEAPTFDSRTGEHARSLEEDDGSRDGSMRFAAVLNELLERPEQTRPVLALVGQVLADGRGGFRS